MSTEILTEYKHITGIRCFHATASSVAVQFVLLTIFLLFINFNLWHPLIWIKETFQLMFSFYTWLLIIPLLITVTTYGLLLSKSYLAARCYYPTRFRWFTSNVINKLSFFLLHMLIGFLTSWMYVRYLHADYRYFVTKCYGLDCINCRYLFLINAGIFVSCYYYFKEKLYKKQPQIQFAYVYFLKIIHIRNILYRGIGSSFMLSLRPMLYFTIIYWLFQSFLNKYMLDIFALETEQKLDKFFTILTDWRLLYYTLLLFSQILSNFYIMEKFFIVFLTYKYEFPIERQTVTFANELIGDITLANALSICKIPLIQNLAACDLYNLSTKSSDTRRREIFALSVPGGHPNNWKNISEECLNVLNEFIKELTSSFETIQQLNPNYKTPAYNVKPFGNERAERMLIRQYNESVGIRHLVSTKSISVNNQKPNSKITKNTHAQNKNYFNKNLATKMTKVSQKIESVKFYAYLLKENDSAKTAFILENSKPIATIIRALGGFCAASIDEDKYGVVQVTLSEIIKTLLKLKTQLDELNNVTINGKKVDKNFVILKSVVKRTLIRITNKFKDYISDIVRDPKDIQKLLALTEVCWC